MNITKPNTFTGKNIYIISVFILCFLFSNRVSANDRFSEQREFWQELYLYHPLGEKFTAGILFNNLYNTSWGNYDWFLQGILKYDLNSFFYIEGMFRQEYYKLGDIWTHESRPMIRIAGKTKLGNWKIRNRHRIEMRMFEFGHTQFRYRTDLRVKPDWDFTAMNLNPYFTEEIFVNSNRLSRVRSYLGIQGKKGRFEPAAFLLIQSRNLVSEWRHILIGGISLEIEI